MNEHLLLDLEDLNGETSRFIWWNGADLPLPEGNFDLAYTIHANNFRGVEQVQFEWIDYRQAHQDNAVEIHQNTRKIASIDYRASKTPTEELARCAASQELSIWKEGSYSLAITGSDRLAIQPSESLAIWSMPPDIHVLQQIIQLARPRLVYWFLISPVEHQVPGFLRTIGKLVKDGLRRQQQYYDLTNMAIQTATTPELAALGLQWMASSGHFCIIEKSPSSYRLVSGGIVDDRQRARLQVELKRSFDELQSFSSYLMRVDLDRLLEDLA